MQRERTRQWVQIDTWMNAHDGTPDAPVPDYQRGPVSAPAAGGNRRGLSGAEYLAAADVARELGVREAARRLGVSHVALLQAWRRRGLQVVSPKGTRRVA